MSRDQIFITVNMIKHTVAAFRKKFAGHRSAQEFDILDKMVLNLSELVKFAVPLDYGNVRANGVRSLIRSAERISNVGLTLSAAEVDDFLFIIKHFNRGISLVLEGADDILSDNFNYEFNRKAVIEACGFGEEVLRRSLSYRYFAINSPAFRPVLMPLFMLSSFIYSLSYYEAFKSLFSFKASVDNYCKSVDRISAAQMSHFIRATDTMITRIVTKIMRFILDRGARYQTASHKVSVPSRFQIVMGPTDVNLERRSITTQADASFSTLRRGSSQKYDDKALMFMHGGAFLGPTADSLEDMYIKEFCSPCPGLTVVNVDYPCAPEHRFPVALQLLLDLYLWLVSGHESVAQTLGFHPKEVVLSGDSCGGNLAAALLLLINDVRMIEPSEELLIPRALALFFPKLSIRLELQPSTCLTMMDSLINLYVLLRVGQAYAPATRKGEDGVAYITNDVPTDYVARKDEFDLLATPYTSIHLYKHLESLSDVHLNIMALHFDPLLDESVRLAKKWKGPVNLQVVDDTCHGAFVFRTLYPVIGTGLRDTAVSIVQTSFSDRH